jgi:DNA adenine methylase
MAWPGGKDGAGVYQRLINQIPPHDVFVSAFLGDCAILRRKRPAKLSIGIDLDRENIDWWTLRKTSGECRFYCCCGIEWLRHRFDLYRRDRRPPKSAAHAAAAENGGPVPQTFVYLDPPYLLETRRTARAIYQHELTPMQHADLLGTALELPCQVMISHYPHELYAKALRGWRTFTFQSPTRGGRMATEQVWCNYPEPEKLHDARFVGNDKRQRERVRRRVNNWVNGLERMLPDERQAVIDAIAGRFI